MHTDVRVWRVKNYTVEGQPVLWAIWYKHKLILNAVRTKRNEKMVMLSVRDDWIFSFTSLDAFIHHFTGLLRTKIMTSSQWLVSSVGRALHWYRRGHGFKSCTGLNCYQAMFSLLLKLCSLLRRSLSKSLTTFLLHFIRQLGSGSSTDPFEL